MLNFILLLFFLKSSSAQQQQSAALIIGGYWNSNPDGTIMNSAELYGCAGGGGAPIRIANLTKTGYLMGGIYRSDTEDVLVCGGYNCGASICGIDRSCETWNPRSGIWDVADVPSMRSVRGSYLMARGPNLNSGNNALNPIAVGYIRTTEIYDWATNVWSNYRDLPENTWNTQGCLYQDHDDQDVIYNVRTNITRLDVRTWTVTDLGEVPRALQAPGRCAPVTIGGHRGIFIRFGYFYDFTLRDWVTKTPPPRNPVATAANAMWSFRGRPTIFGNPKCDNHGVCTNTEVIQYVPESDAWIALGDMSRARTYHEVIEVPGSWCDYFVSPATSTTTTMVTTTVITTTTSKTTATITTTASTTATTTSMATNKRSISFFVPLSLAIIVHLRHLS